MALSGCAGRDSSTYFNFKPFDDGRFVLTAHTKTAPAPATESEFEQRDLQFLEQYLHAYSLCGTGYVIEEKNMQEVRPALHQKTRVHSYVGRCKS